MNAATRLDETLRELVLQRFGEFDAELGPKLLREFIAELVGRWRKAGRLLAAGGRGRHRPAGRTSCRRSSRRSFPPAPAQEDVNRLIQQIAEKLAAAKQVELTPICSPPSSARSTRRYLGRDRRAGRRTADAVHRRCSTSSTAGATRTGASRPARSITRSSTRPWRRYDRYAIEELRKAAEEEGLWRRKNGPRTAAFEGH